MTSGSSISISCDDCTLRCSTACDECVVTFVLQTAHGPVGQNDGYPGSDRPGALIFDLEEQRVVRWMTNAGLVPELLFERVG